MTHAEATKLVSGKNNRMQRKVANNTTARIKPDGSVAFMLYSTDAVSYTHLTLPTIYSV